MVVKHKIDIVQLKEFFGNYINSSLKSAYYISYNILDEKVSKGTI